MNTQNCMPVTHRRRTTLMLASTTVCAALLAATGAQAEDSTAGPSFRIPELAPVTLGGITLFAVVDVSGQYESRGAPKNSNLYAPLNIIAPQARNRQFVFASNQAQQSMLGLKISLPITDGYKLVGRMETGFSPTSLTLADAPGSLQDQNGLTTSQQSASADGPRAGQSINGDAWGGISSPRFGSLTAGRQTSLSFDGLIAYDPLLSYGFSLLGFQGVAGGQGGSESIRVGSSYKYSYANGPFRGSFLYANPALQVRNIWQARAGFDYQGLSLDVIGGQAEDMISAASLGGTDNLESPYIGARVYDSSMVGLFTKYKLAFADASSLTTSAGYERIEFSNPSHGWEPGHKTIGGYALGPGDSATGLAGGGIVNYGFTGGDRILNISFVTLKYQYTPAMSFALGYYRYDQNSFGHRVAEVAPAAATFYSTSSCSSSKLANCSGSEQVIGARVDYLYNRNITLYFGGTYSDVADGLAFGYLHQHSTSVTLGLKLTI